MKFELFKHKIFPLIPVVFVSFLLVQLAFNNVLLTDDAIFVDDNMENKKENIFHFFGNFLNHPYMSSRPVSGFFYGLSVYLVQFGIKFYYLNYLFFIISLGFINHTVKRFFGFEAAFMVTLVYALFPLASSMEFSLIMMNSNMATIFFCLSVNFAAKSFNAKNFLLSALFFVLSVLSYEIFLPLILLIAFILKTKTLNKILYIILTLFVIFFYREVIEPNIFTNYFHRDDKLIFLDINRDIDVVLTIMKSVYYILLSFYKSFKSIVGFGFFDFMLLFGLNIIFFIFLKKSKIPTLKRYHLVIFFLCLLISFAVFFVSDYQPYAKGYNNRSLGAVRLFSVLFLCGFILNIKNNRIKKSVLGVLVFVLSVSAISIKNAWIYANDFNHKLFSELRKNLPENPKSNAVLVTFDKRVSNIRDDRNSQYKNRHYILDEPIYRFENHYLQKINLIDKKYHIYYYYDHTNQKEVDEFKRKTHYLYDFKSNTLELINDSN
jgi:hypothetical protein